MTKVLFIEKKIMLIGIQLIKQSLQMNRLLMVKAGDQELQLKEKVKRGFNISKFAQEL